MNVCAQKLPQGQLSVDQATVFVVDDDSDVRHIVSLLVRSVNLQSELYSSARDFLDAYDPARPGCLVLDVRMPDMSGIELQDELAARHIEIPIIMVTAHGEIPMVTHAMRAGALDFIQKPFSRQTLLDRINQAVEVDARMRDKRSRQENLTALVERVSVREHEVMNLLVAGKTTKEIARKLNISSKTVDNHRAKVLAKMEVDNVPQLILLVLGRPA